MNKIIIIILATVSMSLAAEGHITQLYQRWDVDKDNNISKEEWITSASNRFNMLDTNKDGKLTREEIKFDLKSFRERRKKFQEYRHQIPCPRRLRSAP